jgi:bifunctional NMN adenylyltransferase/nudix hydrolase
MKYKIAAVVGRFEPYHNIHKKLTDYALGLADIVLIVLGSARSAADTHNPFNPTDREQMIRACFDEETNARLRFVGVRDYPYNNNTWKTEVQNAVRNIQEELVDLPEGEEATHNIKLGEASVALVGYDKDETSWYLKEFPQWKFEEFITNRKESNNISATDIRKLLLDVKDYTIEPETLNKIYSLVPEAVYNYLMDFVKTEKYKWLVDESNYEVNYKSQWSGPYPPTFLTTDAVVICKGHVLVVKRKMNPGKGLLALPGGFLAEGLWLEDNAVKELKEETRINLHPHLLKGLIKGTHVFDYPQRSRRGRTVTFAYYFELDKLDLDELPLVKGGDDASHSFWLPLAAVGENEDQFFEDHVHIIRHFTGVA